MKRTNEIINDWKQQREKPHNIVFNITIPTSDFDKMAQEIEEMQQINESTLKLLKKAKGFINDIKPWHEQASSNNADLQNMAENLLILAIHKLES